MASPKTIADDTVKPDTPWLPYQRPGKLGVDYDEYGAEMTPNARVWKKYVEETDRMDKELVDGWNKTLDVILIFAALFSAISTAFVIESSKDLKPDYTESSAQTLLLMSQTLSAIARGSPINDSVTPNLEPPTFTPTTSAVAVNLLWFLSLSLSMAVSLISILAKEWCYSFMAGRVGSMLRQGRIRQQRWDGIEQWRMKEILNVLPLLMHVALLLFAIGLSVYLWSINIRVALPVVITTALAALFYVVTVSLPLFFRFCPYTTALLRFIHPNWIRILDMDRTKDAIATLLTALASISHGLHRLKQSFSERKPRSDDKCLTDADLESPSDNTHALPSFSFPARFQHGRERVCGWIKQTQGMFQTDRSQLGEQETPMDRVTSSMISWMISNCEDSKSVDIALQALAGANLRLLPRRPLWECGAMQLLPQRIRACTDGLLRFPFDSHQDASNRLLDDASLYSRSLSFLTEFFRGEGLKPDPPYSYFVIKGTREPLPGLQGAARDISISVTHHLPWIFCWAKHVRRYEIAALEANSIPVEADTTAWKVIEQLRTSITDWNRSKRSRAPRPGEWELLEYITTGHVVDLPPTAVLSLISGITKTYFYNPSQSPILLVHLLNKVYYDHDPSTLKLKYAIGVGLAVAAIINQNHLAVEPNPSNDLDMQQRRARLAYSQLISRDLDEQETKCLLMFGLLSLFPQPNRRPIWELANTDIQLLGEMLEQWTSKSTSYHSIIPILPASFNRGQHLAQVVSGCLDMASQGFGCDSADTSQALSFLGAVLQFELCSQYGEHFVPLLTRHFLCTESVELKKLCLQGIRNSLLQDYGCTRQAAVFDQLVTTAFLERVIELSGPASGELAPYCMGLLWAAGQSVTLGIFGEEDQHFYSGVASFLQVLRNRFTVDSAEDNYPKDVGDLGLADLWLHSLWEMCHTNPQNVLDSGLLYNLIFFYDEDENVAARPRTTELPSPYDETYTWLSILNHLQESCEKAIHEHAGGSKQSVQEDEHRNPVLDAHERSGDDVSASRDLYWAM